MMTGTEIGGRGAGGSPDEMGGPAAGAGGGGWQRSFEFLVELANCLTEYGAAVYEIEAVLAKVARHLQVGGSFLIHNQALFITPAGGTMPKTSVSLLPSGSPNISKMEAVGDVVHSLLAGEIDISQSRERLRAVAVEPEAYGPISDYASWPLMGAGFAIYFGGAVNECIVGALISATLFKINQYFSRVNDPERRRMFEPVAAATASFLAIAGAVVFPPLSVAIAVSAGLMMLMPGLALTKALNEIALGHTVTGMSRFLNALTILLLMASGVFLGTKLDQMFHLTAADYEPVEAGFGLLLFGVVVATYSCCVYAKVRQRHFPYVLAVAMVMSAVIIGGSKTLGPSLST
ncbi:MAG: threonine/serine exporter family protein, partial [Negativicutes bacterium]|nr:threonine/serine exporter family protein [Negativicutes bacterium]